MIVVDVGCKTFGAEESMVKLVERFQPEILFGFDPHPELVEGVRCERDTLVVTRRAAAGVGNTAVGYRQEGTRSRARITQPGICGPEEVFVPCFDLAVFLAALPPGHVLKLDCEGAEYPLLEHLIMAGGDERCSVLLVEWHHRGEEKFEAQRRMLLGALRCPVEEWQ